MRNVFVVVIAACAPLAAQEIKDELRTKSGKVLRGIEVTEMTSSSIKYKHSDGEDELPASSLSEIKWFDAPEPFTLGLAAMSSAQFDNAANLFGEAAGQIERAPMKLEAEFMAARALVRAAGEDPGKATVAAGKLREFINSAPENYRVAEAKLELGQAQLIGGNAAAAEKTLKELSTLVAAQGLDPLWDVRAKFAIAKAQMALDRLPDARASFRRAKNAADSVGAMSTKPSPVVATLIADSIVGEGETFIVEEKFEDAKRYFKRFERDANPAIAAAAKAGLGEALFLSAEAKKDKKPLRAAQIALAEASLADPIGGSTSAKAIYYSGKVILALGADRESSDYAARASSCFKTVVQHYSDTPWAARAAAELKR